MHWGKRKVCHRFQFRESSGTGQLHCPCSLQLHAFIVFLTFPCFYNVLGQIFVFQKAIIYTDKRCNSVTFCQYYLTIAPGSSGNVFCSTIYRISERGQIQTITHLQTDRQRNKCEKVGFVWIPSGFCSLGPTWFSSSGCTDERQRFSLTY